MIGVIGLLIWFGEWVLLMLNAYGVAVPTNPVPYIMALFCLAAFGFACVAFQAEQK